MFVWWFVLFFFFLGCLDLGLWFVPFERGYSHPDIEFKSVMNMCRGREMRSKETEFLSVRVQFHLYLDRDLK